MSSVRPVILYGGELWKGPQNKEVYILHLVPVLRPSSENGIRLPLSLRTGDSGSQKSHSSQTLDSGNEDNLPDAKLDTDGRRECLGMRPNIRVQPNMTEELRA